jgi:predicted nucleotidyltransferase component of viral defense system
MRTSDMEHRVDLTRGGAWKALFEAALTLTDHLETVIEKPFWTFGGGTVLMLRLNHRQSKDIDLFVPDPQYLGHVTPRLCDAAEQLTDRYVETGGFVKLMMSTGEIDIVVGEPLTDHPWETVPYRGRQIRIETNAEIVAKKMFYRGDQGKARDLLDLCAVAENDPAAIDKAAPFFDRHGRAFIDRLQKYSAYAEEEFAQIELIDYKRSFRECIELAEFTVEAHLQARR